MVPMFKYSDIVVLIGTTAFLISYAVGIIVQIIRCRMKETRFSLVHIAVALVFGFTGAIATFFALYHMLGQS
jgi:hypothetical protein